MNKKILTCLLIGLFFLLGVLPISAEEPIILEEGTVSQGMLETIPETAAENLVILDDEPTENSTETQDANAVSAEDEWFIDEILPVSQPKEDAKESDFVSSAPIQENGPGDSYNKAIGISFDTKYSGTITNQQVKTYYRFEVPSSGRVTLTASAKMEYISYIIFDNEGQQIWSTSVSWNNETKLNNSVFSWDLVEGIYCFSVGQIPFQERTGDYSLRFSFESADESFKESQKKCYNSLDDAREVSFGTDYTGQLAQNDTIDYYWFELESSGRLTFAAQAWMPDVTYTIYEKGGAALWSTDAPWNDLTMMSDITSSVDMVSGTYYLAAEQDWFCKATGKYTFSLSFADAGETFAESLEKRRNNIQNADPLQINRKYRGQLALNDTIDYYKFTLKTATKLTIKASARMSFTTYKIYNSAGSQVWEKDTEWNSLTGRSTLKTAVDLNAGTYYFVVEQVWLYKTTGNYSFSLAVHKHKFADHVTPATLFTDGKIVRECFCGRIKRTVPISHPGTISLSEEEYTYTGKKKTPSVKIYGGDGKIISPSGYSVRYSSGRKKVGSYTVSITFKGNYQGTAQKKFIINPGKSGIVKLAARSNGFKVKVKAQKAEADGYQIQYSMDKTFPILSGTKLLTGRTNVSMTCSGLGRKVKYYVRARTYREVSGTTYYSAWSSAKAVKTK